jgi:hypothetical protein
MEVMMKRILGISLLAVAAACTPAAPIELSGVEQSTLGEALAGRSEGPAVSCVNQRDLRGNRSIGEGVILFTGPGGTVYVNRPAAGCPRIDSGRTLLTRTSSTQLCRGDIVTVVEPMSGMQYGSCGLGDFTPYRRTR